MKPIELPILFYVGDYEKAKLLGKESELQVEKRLTWFLQISFIEPYKYNDNDYSMIHSNGVEVICTMKPRQVIEAIKENELR